MDKRLGGFGDYLRLAERVGMGVMPGTGMKVVVNQAIDRIKKALYVPGLSEARVNVEEQYKALWTNVSAHQAFHAWLQKNGVRYDAGKMPGVIRIDIYDLGDAVVKFPSQDEAETAYMVKANKVPNTAILDVIFYRSMPSGRGEYAVLMQKISEVGFYHDLGKAGHLIALYTQDTYNAGALDSQLGQAFDDPASLPGRIDVFRRKAQTPRGNRARMDFGEGDLTPGVQACMQLILDVVVKMYGASGKVFSDMIGGNNVAVRGDKLAFFDLGKALRIRNVPVNVPVIEEKTASTGTQASQGPLPTIGQFAKGDKVVLAGREDNAGVVTDVNSREDSVKVRWGNNSYSVSLRPGSLKLVG
jgi:hypothetical protein